VQSNIKGLIAPWPHKKFDNLCVWSAAQSRSFSAFFYTANN